MISAITKDKNIVHDFKKIIDSKITGKPVHVEELKSVNEPVGTRSKVDVENIVEGRVAKFVVLKIKYWILGIGWQDRIKNEIETFTA